MLTSLLLQLHLRRKENLPSVKWLPLGITVYAECSFSLFQMHFKALLVKEKINVQSRIFGFAYNSGLLYFGYFVFPDDFKVILLT